MKRNEVVKKATKGRTVFIKDGVMVGNKAEPCIVCGKPTRYIEVRSEAHVCSDECIRRFYEMVAKKEREE